MPNYIFDQIIEQENEHAFPCKVEFQPYEVSSQAMTSKDHSRRHSTNTNVGSPQNNFNSHLTNLNTLNATLTDKIGPLFAVNSLLTLEKMVIRFYQFHLARRPFVTQVATTAFLFGAGDLLAQHTVEKKPLSKSDHMRTGRMILYGGAVFGPAATKWYAFLQKRIHLSTPMRTTLGKVAVDQLVFTPVNMFCFLSSMAFMEGWPPTASRDAVTALHTPPIERIKARLSDTYITGIKMNFLVWPWVQTANFSVVPLEHRVLVVNIVALGWNCYLSYLNNSNN